MSDGRVHEAGEAKIFTGLTGGVIAFQLPLVGGAPCGALTHGGRVIGGPLLGARTFALFTTIAR